MNRNRLWWVGWLVVLGAGIWQGPALARAWQTNWMALAAMDVCVGTRDLSAVAEAPPFLQAGAARCMGNETVAQAQYLEAVSSTDRVDVLHAAYPSDVELARLAVQTYPTRAEAYFWLAEAMLGGLHVWQVPAQALAERADLSELIAVYEKGVAFVPTNGEEWDNLGQLYRATGDWEKAAPAFNQACHYRDVGRNGCLSAGYAYMQLGLYEQALARYQDSLQLLPDYPGSSRKGIVQALIALHRSQEAIPHLKILAAQGDAEAQTQLKQFQALP